MEMKAWWNSDKTEVDVIAEELARWFGTGVSTYIARASPIGGRVAS